MKNQQFSDLNNCDLLIPGFNHVLHLERFRRKKTLLLISNWLYTTADPQWLISIWLVPKGCWVDTATPFVCLTHFGSGRTLLSYLWLANFQIACVNLQPNGTRRHTTNKRDKRDSNSQARIHTRNHPHIHMHIYAHSHTHALERVHAHTGMHAHTTSRPACRMRVTQSLRFHGWRKAGLFVSVFFTPECRCRLNCAGLCGVGYSEPGSDAASHQWSPETETAQQEATSTAPPQACSSGSPSLALKLGTNIVLMLAAPWPWPTEVTVMLILKIIFT